MDNFTSQPVGRSVLFLNDFGREHLGFLNRISAESPKVVRGLASLIYNVDKSEGFSKASELFQAWVSSLKAQTS
jgi:hypothetical protein